VSRPLFNVFDLKKMSVRRRRKIAKDRDAWNLILKEAGVLHKP
jgi:hypothetical protein